MSTDYRPVQRLSASDLFDGRLRAHGITEHPSDDNREHRRCLTDGKNHLWVWYNERGMIVEVTEYVSSDTYYIRRIISEVYNVEFASEHEPRYWGFETEAEWQAAMDRDRQERRDTLYATLVTATRGRTHDLDESTADGVKAQIANDLVFRTPDLLSPERKEELLDAVEAAFQQDRTTYEPAWEIESGSKDSPGG